MYARLQGSGSYLPERILTNADLEQKLDTTHDWMVARTGIHQRHIIAPEETVANMAEIAAVRALEDAGVSAEQLGLIVVATTTPDVCMPSVACTVQNKLGISGCPAFDLNAACSGFIYGLSVADQYIRSGAVTHALVVGSDALSRIVDWTDRATCVLFGDGAGAVVLQASETMGVVSTHIHAHGAGGALLRTPTRLIDRSKPVHIEMQGNAVYRMAVEKLGDAVEEILSEQQLSHADIDWLVPHQANIRIIQATAKRLCLPMEKVILTVQKHGNTSAASIPLALDDGIRSGRICRGQRLLLEAFGAGLTWGSALINY